MPALLPRDAHANVRLSDHGDVICAVTNRKRDWPAQQRLAVSAVFIAIAIAAAAAAAAAVVGGDAALHVRLCAIAVTVAVTIGIGV